MVENFSLTSKLLLPSRVSLDFEQRDAGHELKSIDFFLFLNHREIKVKQFASTIVMWFFLVEKKVSSAKTACLYTKSRATSSPRNDR